MFTADLYILLDYIINILLFKVSALTEARLFLVSIRKTENTWTYFVCVINILNYLYNAKTLYAQWLDFENIDYMFFKKPSVSVYIVTVLLFDGIPNSRWCESGGRLGRQSWFFPLLPTLSSQWKRLQLQFLPQNDQMFLTRILNIPDLTKKIHKMSDSDFGL